MANKIAVCVSGITSRIPEYKKLVDLQRKVFGEYDFLKEPEYIPKGVDFICFSDQNFKSNIWEVKKSIPLYKDNTRKARKYKILPHRCLSNYDVSIWLDGNKIIKGNVLNYLNYLGKNKLALYDHMLCFDKRNCIYQEANAIFSLGNEPGKSFKDDPLIIKKQMEKYLSKGYPIDNGLAFTCGIIRKHNDKEVVKVMEDWWHELKYGSKRDQLSFNYVAWKNNFAFNYLPGDGRDDNIIIHKSHK